MGTRGSPHNGAAGQRFPEAHRQLPRDASESRLAEKGPDL